MLSEQLQKRFVDIVADAVKMVTSHVDNNDLATGIDYASIYAQSPEDFSQISQELKNNGTVALERTSGNYYKLKRPLNTLEATILHCRVRAFDKEHPEQGYVDFEVKDYKQFKNKYLSRQSFSLLTSGEEMVELRDSKFTVRAYFPSSDF